MLPFLSSLTIPVLRLLDIEHDEAIFNVVVLLVTLKHKSRFNGKRQKGNDKRKRCDAKILTLPLMTYIRNKVDVQCYHF